LLDFSRTPSGLCSKQLVFYYANSCEHRFMPIWLAPGISALGVPTIAQAEVHVEGTVAAVHVTTDKDAIPDVLSAFERPFNLRYRTSVPLNGNVSSEDSGSLAYVISRRLGGYDYVIAHDRGTIELVVSGKRGEAAAPVQKPVTARHLHESAMFRLTLEHIPHVCLYLMMRATVRR
jgi:hypothetical protein